MIKPVTVYVLRRGLQRGDVHLISPVIERLRIVFNGVGNLIVNDDETDIPITFEK